MDEGPQIAIIMGSRSDWPVMKSAADILDTLGIAYVTRITSAHRTPDRLERFAKRAKAAGFKIIIAGAGGSAHLPGMAAAWTVLPVLAVPIPSATNFMNTLAAFFSMIQMPAGVTIATFPVGNPIELNPDKPNQQSQGALNAGLFAAQMLAAFDPEICKRVQAYRRRQTRLVPITVED